MMKKYLILLCSIFLISGCSATYTLNIDDELTDELKITMNDNEYNEFNSDSKEFLIMQYVNSNNATETDPGVKAEGIDYYDFKKNDATKTAIYTSKFKNSKLGDNVLIKNVFNDYIIRRTSDELYIKTDKEFTFPNDKINSVQIVFDSPYKVLYSNAQHVVGNKLIWNITENNAANASIEVNYSTDSNSQSSAIDEPSDEEDNQEGTDYENNVPSNDQGQAENTTNNKGNSSMILVPIVVIVTISGIVIFVFLNLKKKKLNQI